MNERLKPGDEIHCNNQIGLKRLSKQLIKMGYKITVDKDKLIVIID